MKRRHLLKAALGVSCVPLLPACALQAGAPSPGGLVARVRPGQPGWPSQAAWAGLNTRVGGRLEQLVSPLESCQLAVASPACTDTLAALENPFAISDTPALAQILGWVGAWTFRPSTYAVLATQPADVVAAVEFAREHHLRLVIKGGGHSYQGASSSADSLLVWMHGMNRITVHDDFVPHGSAPGAEAVAAVSVGAGALWIDVYNAVTTHGGRYVQGGGCTTVGVAGLLQGGGFGSFSKAYGLAAASLLEAEVVTADGQVRIVNAMQDADLFWALKGGGGGVFGVVTQVTLKTHPLPDNFGAAIATVQSHSRAAYRLLIERLLVFAEKTLVNPHWGEQLRFSADGRLDVRMVFSGLSRDAAAALWRPFFDELKTQPEDYTLAAAPQFLSIPAAHFWDAQVLKRAPGLIQLDARPGASGERFYWTGDGAQAGEILYGYSSLWLPRTLLKDDRRAQMVEALMGALEHWSVELHLNKGLAGAPAEVLAAAGATAIHPAALEAFALAIIAGNAPMAYPGIAGHEPDLARARRDAGAIAAAMQALRTCVPAAASYAAEGDYFEADWSDAFWGANYARLSTIKARVDPEGVFFVRHMAGSEAWSEDGFVPRTRAA